MAHRKDPDGKVLRLVLVDPGWLTPARRDITIRVQNSKALLATDLIGQRALELQEEGKRLDVTIPEGLFRILDVHLQ